MAEFLFKRNDFIHSDPEKDRRGVHKKTDFINHKPDGFSDFSHGNGPGSYLADFVIIKVSEIPLAEAEASDHRKSWRDDLGYEITATRTAQGEYDIRVFEKNAGAIGQNHVAGIKATKIRNYMLAWGCSNFSLSETDGSFTFSLWDAVRSANCWGVDALKLSTINFTLNSYTPATGIAQIQVEFTDDTLFGRLRLNDSEVGEVEGNIILEEAFGIRVERKITEIGGTLVSYDFPIAVFTIERSDILTRFRADVKRRMEQTYMRHQYGISQADHAAIVAAGGVVTMTRAEFMGKLIDKMAAI
jgi:hypothetical protein